MSDLARPGGTAELCLRPAIPAARFIRAEQLAIHPAAAPAFEIYRTIPVSARLPALLAGPIPALRGPGGQASFFSHFAERIAFRDAQTVPVIIVSGLDKVQIERIAWAEILLPTFGQLHPGIGFRGLYSALKRMPEDVRRPAFETLSDRAIARHLSCDVSRFRKVSA